MTALGSRVVTVLGLSPDGRRESRTLALPPGLPRELGDALALAWCETVLGMTGATVGQGPRSGPLDTAYLVEVPDEHLLARMLDAWQRARLETGR